MTLGDVATWVSGGTPRRSVTRYWRGEIPWISAATLKHQEVADSDQHVTLEAVRAGSQLAPVGAVLILVRGMALLREVRAGVAIRPVAFNQDVKALIPSGDVTSRYLMYSIHVREREVRGLVTLAGSGTGVLETTSVKRLPIWVPPLDEQARITHRLDEASRQVELLERLVAKKRAIKQGMMQQLLWGRTRLPGFTGTWEWRPFPEVMTRINAKRFQIPAYAYRFAGRVPVVDQGQSTVVGYTDDMVAAFDPGVDGVVVFGDHTCITKFVNFKFAVGADGTQLVKALPGNSTRFMAYALEASPVLSTGYNRHFKLLKEKIFQVPPLAEQDAIVEMLAHADRELVSLHGRLSKARAMKQGLMQELLTGRTRLPAESVS